ncbi:MAG: DNA polymerase I [Ruminococcaceae bacterium]|nr:DNA polymerase I [Oscillospiraceae bacterium]
MKKGEMYTLLKELEFTSHIKKFGLSEADASVSADEQTERFGESKTSAEGGGSAASDDVSDGKTAEKPRLSAPAIEDIPLSELKKLGGRSFAFAVSEGEAAFCDAETCYRTEFAALSELASAVADSGVRLTAFDSKKYLSMFLSAGASSDKVIFEDDIILCAYVIDPARNGYDLSEMWEIYGQGSLGEGVCGEAAAVIYLRDVFLQKLSDVGMLKLYREIELPLAAVLADMEHAGFKLDTAALTDFLEMLKETETEQAKRIYMLAGREFNINSPKQLGEVLFEELKLPAGKKTKTGYSTGAEILEKLRPEHPIISEILEYRAVAKLRSTYAEGLLKAADGEGRVHTVFSQTTAVTGRLSSSEPNLQNIPVRTELGREMRRFFIASDQSRVLIDADYSQIELRLLAHIARDQVMTDAFVSGEDVHAVTASQVFDVPLDKVTPEMRKRAKAVNFGIVYGIGEFSLAQDIGVPRKVAGEYIKNYFAKYTGIDAYLSAAVESAKALGYVETIFGRRRYIPELTSAKAMLRAFGERVAMNSPIQGSSADIIKLAMINVSRALKSEGLDARLILQIHDELIVESSKSDAPRASEILRREMENVVSLTVPLTVDLQLGSSWFECK